MAASRAVNPGGHMPASYNVHRWYERQTGRFTRVDPLGVEGGPNPYTFAAGRPTILGDPLGLKFTNNANCVAYVKEEGTGKTHPIPPGETWNGPQDGFAVPCCRSCEVYKTTDGVDAVVEMTCSVNTSGGPVDQAVQAIRGGWKDRSWNDDQNKKGDEGWNDLFDDACPPPEACIPESEPGLPLPSNSWGVAN